MKRYLVFACLSLAVLSATSSLYMSGKSVLGQFLLKSAWSSTLESGQTHKAWPWADTWPAALLYVRDTNKSLVVLEGVSGEAMAFGPGRIQQSSTSARSGTFAIGGHRDSHLAFLQNVELHDIFDLQTRDGAKGSYRVVDRFVADVTSDSLVLPKDLHALVLVTCYPFNALQTGGPLRYVVVAESVDESV